MEKEEKIQALFTDVARFSSTSKDFLEQNGDNIIRLSEQGQAQLPLFAKYSSEYPCLLQSMVDWSPSMESAYRGYRLHINLETIPRQPRGYDVRDDPQYADRRGPISEGDCRAAPSYSQKNLPGPATRRPGDRGRLPGRQARRARVRPHLRLRRNHGGAVRRQRNRRIRDGSPPR